MEDKKYTLPDFSYFIYVFRRYRTRACVYDFYQNMDVPTPYESAPYMEDNFKQLINNIDESRKRFPNDKFEIRVCQNGYMYKKNENKIRIKAGFIVQEGEKVRGKVKPRILQNKEIAEKLNYEIMIFRKTEMYKYFVGVNIEDDNVQMLKNRNATVFRMAQYGDVLKLIQAYRSQYTSHSYQIRYRPSDKTCWKPYETFKSLEQEQAEKANKEEVSSERQ